MVKTCRLHGICVFTLFALGVLSPRLFANPADLDPTFAGTGVLTGFGGGRASCEATLVQPDGKVVLVGALHGLPSTNEQYMVIARFTTNGLPDFSFGHSGRVSPTIKFGSYTSRDSYLFTAKVQSDGKIVAGGEVTDNTGHYHYALFRCNTNGQPDTTFGTNGTGVISLTLASGLQNGSLRKIALQSDGKIVAIGDYLATNNTGYAIIRCLTNGLPDPSFGGGGYYLSQSLFGTTNFSPECIYLQSNGKINVAGSKSNPVHAGIDLALYQFNTNGTLDTSFGQGAGFVQTTISNPGDNNNYSDGAGSIALLTSPVVGSAATLLLAGSYYNHLDHGVVALVSYNLDGTLNTNFGTGGIATSDLYSFGVAGSYAKDVIIQGTLFHARTITIFGGASDTITNGNHFLAARYTSAGVLDTTFANNGYAIYDVGLWNNDFPASMALQGTNFILAGSSEFTTNIYHKGLSTSANFVFSAIRLDGQGQLDYSFGDDGYLYADIAEGQSYLNSVVVQPDGKILAGGYFLRGNLDSGGSQVLALARCYPDGTPDYLFGFEGKAIIPLAASARIMALALQADGKILAAVSYATPSDGSAVVRLRSNGSIDTTFGTNGVWKVNAGILAIKVQNDGKILVGGSDGTDFFAARATTNGLTDISFGAGGYASAVFSTGPNDAEGLGLDALLIQPDGKVILGGTVLLGDQGVYDFALARFNTNGSTDIQFGSLGRTLASPGSVSSDQGYCVALQPDGKILMGGVVVLSSSAYYFGLARFATNGVLDTTFGINGFSIIPDVGQQEGIAMTVQQNGKILLAGMALGQSSGTNDQAILRQYNSDGTLDTSFGANGITYIDFNTHQDEDPRSITMDSTGHILIGAAVGNTFGIARLMGLSEMPRLKIALTATNTISVSWSQTPNWWSLQQCTDLAAGVWATPAETLQTNSADYYIVVNSPTLTKTRFYRLVPPVP